MYSHTQQHISANIPTVGAPTPLKARILILGGTGLLGKLAGQFLSEQGWAITCIGVEAPDYQINGGYPCRYYQWDGKSPLSDAMLEDVTAIINLAGEPLPKSHWNLSMGRKYLSLRLKATAVAVDAAQRCAADVMIQASSVAIYGHDRKDEVCEDAGVGGGFWAKAIARWEAAAAPAADTTRLVTLRLAQVFSLFGGTLRQRLRPYCLRLGTPAADHDLLCPWIHYRDFCRIVHMALVDKTVSGPINAVAPSICSFHRLHAKFREYYPTFTRIPAPQTVRRFLEGPQLPATKTKVRPARLLNMDFSFNFNTIEECLEDMLDPTSPHGFYDVLTQWVPAPRNEVWDFFAEAKYVSQLTPKTVHLKLKPTSASRAEEGSEFDFDLYYFGRMRGPWRVKHVNIVEPYLSESIVQEGMTNMVKRTRTLTEVAGGTRIDEVMRFQVPFHGVFTYFTEKFIAYLIHQSYTHRQKEIARVFKASPSSVVDIREAKRRAS